jgi:hypothetical protein
MTPQYRHLKKWLELHPKERAKAVRRGGKKGGKKGWTPERRAKQREIGRRVANDPEIRAKMTRFWTAKRIIQLLENEWE